MADLFRLPDAAERTLLDHHAVPPFVRADALVGSRTVD